MIVLTFIIPLKIKNLDITIIKKNLNKLSKLNDVETIIIASGYKKKIELKKLQKLNLVYQFKLVSRKKLIAPGIARNIGIVKSIGKFIWFVDSDDLIVGNINDLIYEIKNKKKEAIFFNYKIYKKKKPERNFNNFIYKDKSKNIKKMISMNYDHHVMAFVLKKSFLIKNEILFPNGIHEDILFFFKVIFYANRIKIIDKVYYNKIPSKKSITSMSMLYRSEYYFKAWYSIKKFLIKNKLFDKYSDSFNKGIIGVLGLILSKMKTNRKITNRLKKIISIKFNKYFLINNIAKNYVFNSKYDNHVRDLISRDYGKPKKYIKNY